MGEAVQQGMAIMYPAAIASAAEAAAPGGGAAATAATAAAGEQEAVAAAAGAEAGPSGLRAKLRSLAVGAPRRKGYHGQASKVW